MILRLWVAEDKQKSDESGECGREPEEAAPAMVAANGTRHDGSEEGSREVEGEIRCHPCSSFMEEEHIRNRLHHYRFAGRSNDTITCASRQ